MSIHRLESLVDDGAFLDLAMVEAWHFDVRLGGVGVGRRTLASVVARTLGIDMYSLRFKI
jgi:hypothetical protein